MRNCITFTCYRKLIILKALFTFKQKKEAKTWDKTWKKRIRGTMKKTREGWEGSNMYKMREGEKSVTGRGGGGARDGEGQRGKP